MGTLSKPRPPSGKPIQPSPQGMEGPTPVPRELHTCSVLGKEGDHPPVSGGVGAPVPQPPIRLEPTNGN